MKLITFKDIQDLDISASTCYLWAAEMIQKKKDALLHPKISMKPSGDIFCNVMPSMIKENGEYRWSGVKIVTRYPNRIPSLESNIMLMDGRNGEMLALMDGTWITAMRTGAVAAHSIMLFGKSGFSIIGMMGLGNVSRASLLVLAEQMPDRELHIKLLKYKNQAEDFALRFSEYSNLKFTIVDTYEEMVKGSDVVISGATYLPEDICSDDCFEKGVLVVPIHTLGFTNCDLFFDKIFGDDTGHIAHFRNFDRFKSFAEVSDVVNNIARGRENDDERILAYNIGISVHDIFFASKIYRLMEEKGLLSSLPEVDLKEPIDKFWI